MARPTDQNSFRRGIMPLVILQLLQKEDMYGYQLVMETHRITGGRIRTQEGSLYPVLYKLQEQGLISDRKVLVSKRMSRIYYHLEPSGAEKLMELHREFDDIATGIRMLKEAEHL